MNIYEFGMIDQPCIEVVADSLDEAYDKAYDLIGCARSDGCLFLMSERPA